MIKRLLIEALLRQLLDPTTREQITRLVATVADSDMSGDEKRDYVVDELRAWGVGAAHWVINLAIELLVAKYRV